MQPKTAPLAATLGSSFDCLYPAPLLGMGGKSIHVSVYSPSDGAIEHFPIVNGSNFQFSSATDSDRPVEPEQLNLNINPYKT